MVLLPGCNCCPCLYCFNAGGYTMSCGNAVAGPVTGPYLFNGVEGTFATGQVVCEITPSSFGQVWTYEGRYVRQTASDGGPSYTSTNTCFDPPQGTGETTTFRATSSTISSFTVSCTELQIRLSASLEKYYYPPPFQLPRWSGTAPCTFAGTHYWTTSGEYSYLGAPELRKSIASTILPSECRDSVIQFIDHEMFISMSESGVSVNTGGQIVDIPWGPETYQDRGLRKQSFSGEARFFSNANATTVVSRGEVEQFFFPVPTKTWHIRK